MVDETPELQVGRNAARQAGEVLMRHFRQDLAGRSKAGDASYNLVSDADVEAEKAIVEVLSSAFPNHAIFGEEERRDALDAEHLWVIDPLDGTNNFLHDLPHFAVSIAYFHEGQPQCGVVFNPAREDEYIAVRGGGAAHNGEPMRTAPVSRLDQVLAGVGFYYDRGAMMESTLAAIADLFREHVHGVRRFGTAALDLCQVANGQFGSFFEYELSPWDFAAGWLIVEEAGGRMTTCRGEPITLQKSSILASTPGLYDAVFSIVRRHIPESLP